MDRIDGGLHGCGKWWWSNDDRGESDLAGRDGDAGGDVDGCSISTDGNWDDGARGANRFSRDLVGLGNLICDGADLIDGSGHDDGLGRNSWAEGSGLGDGGGGHGHVDCSHWPLREGNDNGCFFAIDAEGVGGEALDGDDEGESDERQGGGGGEHRGVEFE